MKILFWFMAMSLLLAACQPQATSTPAAPTAALPVATNTETKSVSTLLPTIAPVVSPTPAVHMSSTDPNAANLIVVRDQPVVNSSVTIDTVRAAQAGWLAIYLSKNDKPGHRMGFVAVQAGTVQQLNVPLDPNSGVSIAEAFLAGRQLFAVLQSGSKAPGSPVEVNGRSVLEPFTVLASNP